MCVDFEPEIGEGSGIPFRINGCRFFCRASIFGPLILVFFTGLPGSEHPMEIVSLHVSVDDQPPSEIPLSKNLLTRDPSLLGLVRATSALRVTHSIVRSDAEDSTVASPSPDDVADSPRVVVYLTIRKSALARRRPFIDVASAAFERRSDIAPPLLWGFPRRSLF